MLLLLLMLESFPPPPLAISSAGRVPPLPPALGPPEVDILLQNFCSFFLLPFTSFALSHSLSLSLAHYLTLSLSLSPSLYHTKGRLVCWHPIDRVKARRPASSRPPSQQSLPSPVVGVFRGSFPLLVDTFSRARTPRHTHKHTHAHTSQ
uniref:Putative secreted protein n=1 Tax=Anopheles darlingi TaxID=43151 RepID=A0A2M4D7C3_ANODA